MLITILSLTIFLKCIILIIFRVAYAALYNVSIQFNGHLLMENNKLIETIHNDIKKISNNNINDKSIYALKLLHSLTKNMNQSMYIIIKREVSNVPYIPSQYINYIISK